MEKDYSAQIIESSKELTPMERIKLKDASNAIRLDEATKDGKTVVITPVLYAVVKVHNEKSESKDYNHYVIVDKDGNKYVTGSESFFRAFSEIWVEVEDCGEQFELEVFAKPSKNYSGKTFLTCAVR